MVLFIQKGGVLGGRLWHSLLKNHYIITRNLLKSPQRQTHTCPKHMMGRDHQYEYDEADLWKFERMWSEPKGMDTGIVIYNTLTKRRDPLILPDGFVKWYSCGPTVYDSTHIGHAWSYVNLDIIRRILISVFNIDVIMMMGVTDIDDKIIKRAQDSATPGDGDEVDIGKISRKYEREFFRDMSRLNVLGPTITARVTENIDEIISFISRIIDHGHAYVSPVGNVYFNVSNISHYPKLLLFNVEDDDNNNSKNETVDKRNPRDFSLWKSQKPGEPYFESPWSRGRPGWHIECSAMSSKIFGQTLDIHTGGIDLAFPHHSNEIAQCESCHQVKQWSNYFIHTGHLHLKDDPDKMSKSLNNFLTVGEMLEKYSSNHFRMFCLLSRYRRGVEYGDESMLRAVAVYKTISAFINNAKSYVYSGGVNTSNGVIDESNLLHSLKKTKDEVRRHLADDFTTSQAVSAIEGLVHECNTEIFTNNNNNNHDDDDKQGTSDMVGSRSPAVVSLLAQYVEEMMGKLGITFSQKNKVISEGVFSDVTSVVESAVKFRSDVRDLALSKPSRSDDRKNDRKVLLKYCDELRDSMKETGIEIKDRKGEASWNFSEKNNFR